MNYHDQHLHTYFSFDSEESFENYLVHHPDYFVSTEHFDLKNPWDNFNDSLPDYRAYAQKITELEKKYPTKFLTGIEIGVVPGQEKEIYAFLADKKYDLILLSIHQNGSFDYMDPKVLQMEKYQVIKNYFDQMITVLSHFKYGDVLSHFDYGLRQFSLSKKELIQHFEKELHTIMTLALKRNLAIELNAKSFDVYGNAELYDYFISTYVSLGGKFFTLGSDAHIATDYERAFPQMKQLLLNNGITELSLFLPEGRVQVPIK